MPESLNVSELRAEMAVINAKNSQRELAKEILKRRKDTIKKEAK